MLRRFLSAPVDLDIELTPVDVTPGLMGPDVRRVMDLRAGSVEALRINVNALTEEIDRLSIERSNATRSLEIEQAALDAYKAAFND